MKKCSQCGKFNPEGRDVCFKCGTEFGREFAEENQSPAVTSAEESEPKTSGSELLEELAESIDKLDGVFTSSLKTKLKPLGVNRYKVDMDTPLKTLIMAGPGFMTFLLLGAIICTATTEFKIPALVISFLILLAAGAWYTWWNTDIYYIMDGNKNEIVLHRKVLNAETEIQVSRFDELCLVSIDSKYVRAQRNSYFKYSIILITPSGKKIRVTDWTTDFDNCSTNAQRLARFLKTKFVPGQKRKWVKIRPGDRSGEYRIEHWNMLQVIFCEPAHLISMGLVAAILILLWILRLTGEF